QIDCLPAAYPSVGATARALRSGALSCGGRLRFPAAGDSPLLAEPPEAGDRGPSAGPAAADEDDRAARRGELRAVDDEEQQAEAGADERPDLRPFGRLLSCRSRRGWFRFFCGHGCPFLIIVRSGQGSMWRWSTTSLLHRRADEPQRGARPGPPDPNGGGFPESPSIVPPGLQDQGSIECPCRPDRLAAPARADRRPRRPDCSPGFVRPPGRFGRGRLRPVGVLSGRLGGSGGWFSGFRTASGGGPRSSKSSACRALIGLSGGNTSVVTSWEKAYSTDPPEVFRTLNFRSVFAWWCGRHRLCVFSNVVCPPAAGRSWSKGMMWSTSAFSALRVQP